jgi:hypothetical protein
MNCRITYRLPVWCLLMKSSEISRMVRDLALEAGKDTELVLEGNDIELDKAVLGHHR